MINEYSSGKEQTRAQSPNADMDLDLLAARAYARVLTRTYSKSFYIATQFMPSDRRDDVYAVYAFCRYTDNIVDAPRHRATATLKRELDAWREEVCTAFLTGESQHPVLVTFIQTARAYDIPLQLAQELIDGVEMDLVHDRYESFTELRTFCYRVASVVGLMMTRVFGYRDQSAFPYAEDLGIAMQLTNILRDVDEDWRLRGKIYLPVNEMRAHGITDEDIAKRRLDPAMKSFLKAQVDRAHVLFESAEHGIPLLHHSGQTAVRAAARLYRGILMEIERNDYDIFSKRQVVPTRRKIAVLGSMMLSTLFARVRNGISHRQLPPIEHHGAPVSPLTPID